MPVRPARRPSSSRHRRAVPLVSSRWHCPRNKTHHGREPCPRRVCESPLPSSFVLAQCAELSQGGEQVLWAPENLLNALKTLSLLIISRPSSGYKLDAGRCAPRLGSMSSDSTHGGGSACHDEVTRSVAERGRSCRDIRDSPLTIGSVVGAQPVTNGCRDFPGMRRTTAALRHGVSAGRSRQ
jgi:hypothetical protein